MEQEQKYGLTVKYIQDEDALNPRKEFDNFGTMACFHRHYTLGDKDNCNIDDLKALVGGKDYISLPLYLYDHSGLTISTSPFSCSWDSGQVGYIFVSKEDVKKEYSCKRISPKILKKVYALLESEVQTYDAYLTGEVYGYVIEDENGERLYSCWGYFCGTKEERQYLRQEAERAALYESKRLVGEGARRFAIETEPTLAA